MLGEPVPGPLVHTCLLVLCFNEMVMDWVVTGRREVAEPDGLTIRAPKPSGNHQVTEAAQSTYKPVSAQRERGY